MSHISCKVKHCIQNIISQKQTFVLLCKQLCHNIIFLDISYTQSYSKPNALLSFSMYISVKDRQRDVDKIDGKHESKIATKLFIFLM